MKGREENLFLKLLLLVVVLFLLLLQLCGGAQVPQLKCGDQKTPSGVVPLLLLWDPGIKFRSSGLCGISQAQENHSGYNTAHAVSSKSFSG